MDNATGLANEQDSPKNTEAGDQAGRGGVAGGLVDVKVVRYAETHAATKSVMRKAERS